MKFLSILVLVLSCFASYGATEESNVQQEERKALVEEARNSVAEALKTANRTEQYLKQGSEELAEEIKTLSDMLSKYNGLLYSSKQIREAMLKVQEANEKLLNLEKGVRKASLSEAREILQVARSTVSRTENDLKQESEELAEEIKKLLVILDKNIFYSTQGIREAMFKVRAVNEKLLMLEEERNTEAKGANRCATCDDEHSPSHTAQVERGENTNPEAAEESRVKKGARGGDSGSR